MKLFNLAAFSILFYFVNNSVWASVRVDQSENSSLFPIQYLINSTLDVTQNEVWFNQNNFDSKTKLLFQRVENPFKTMRNEGGYNQFIKDEFFGPRVIPNIFLHTLGGAYDALWLRQYYEDQGFRYSKLLSYTTIYLARLGNEITEADQKEVNGGDHIADLYIFDLASLFLASHEGYMSFLVDELGMKAWHFQPMWNQQEDLFQNVGLNYILRPSKLSFADNKLTPFAHFGMQNLGGLSYDISAQGRLSLGVGAFYTDPLKQEGSTVVGAFYESLGDLHSSLFYNGSNDLKWRLNIYPTAFKELFSAQLGVFAAVGNDDQFAAGLSLIAPVGLSF